MQVDRAHLAPRETKSEHMSPQLLTVPSFGGNSSEWAKGEASEMFLGDSVTGLKYS